MYSFKKTAARIKVCALVNKTIHGHSRVSAVLAWFQGRKQQGQSKP